MFDQSLNAHMYIYFIHLVEGAVCTNEDITDFVALYREHCEV